MTTIGPNMRVKCISTEIWVNLDTREIANGPKYGDICFVTKVKNDNFGDWLILAEWPAEVLAKYFRPFDWLDDMQEVARRNEIEQPDDENAFEYDDVHGS